MQNRIKNRTVPKPLTYTYHYARTGVIVGTPHGPGEIVDVLVIAAEWPDEPKMQLLPPEVTVKLEQPWEGENEITLPLSEITLEDRHVFRDPIKDLWPGQAPASPNEELRPTTKPEDIEEMKVSSISDMIREASLREILDEDLPEEDEEETEEDEILEEPGPYSSEQYSELFDYPLRDPNGLSYWTQHFYRPPFIHHIWTHHGSISKILRDE